MARVRSAGVGTSVETSEITDGSITTDKLADGAVTVIKTTNVYPAAQTSIYAHSTTIGDYTTPSGAVSVDDTTANYSDNFDGSDLWTDADSARIGVDTTNDRIGAVFLQDNTNDASAYDVGAGNVSDTKWVLRFTLQRITAATTCYGFIGISSASQATGQGTAQDFIGFSMEGGGDGYITTCEADGVALPVTAGDANFTIASPTSASYMEIERTSTTAFVVRRYSDATYSTVLQSASATIPATIASLRYIKILNRVVTGSLTVTFYIDNMRFYNNKIASEIVLPTALNDDSTATVFTSTSGANRWAYMDLGVNKEIAGIALYPVSGFTETEIKIQYSTDAAAWTDLRTITVSNLTLGAWNYIRFNRRTARYIRIYGNSGSALVLKIAEFKALYKTESEWGLNHGHLNISATDTSLILDGTAV